MTKEEKRQSIKKELLGKYGIKTDRDLVKQLGIKDEDKSKLYLWIEYQRCFSYEEGYRNCIESENERLIRAVKMAIRDKYMLSGRELNEVDKHTINGTTLPDRLVKRISEYTSICSIVGNDIWKI